MSLFNKLRAFPAWHNMDDALDAAIKAAARKHKAFLQWQGNCFNEFARKQPEEVHEPLFRLSETLKQADETFKQGDDSLTKLRTELAQLRTLNDDIRAKRKVATALTQRVEKSTKQVDTSQRKLANLRAKNAGSPECIRAEDEYAMAVRQKESDALAAEQKNTELKIDEREYKRQLFTAILNALDEYVNTKRTAAASVVSIGNQIAEVGDIIPFYDDPLAESMQTQIQTLRSEPVE